jgi:hypothetical protein
MLKKAEKSVELAGTNVIIAMEGIDYCSMVMILGMDMFHMLSISMEGIDYCSNGYDSGYGYVSNIINLNGGD